MLAYVGKIQLYNENVISCQLSHIGTEFFFSQSLHFKKCRFWFRFQMKYLVGMHLGFKMQKCSTFFLKKMSFHYAVSHKWITTVKQVFQLSFLVTSTQIKLTLNYLINGHTRLPFFHIFPPCMQIFTYLLTCLLIYVIIKHAR